MPNRCQLFASCAAGDIKEIVVVFQKCLLAAQYLLSAYETAASPHNCSQPQTVLVDLLRADMMRGSFKGIQPFERKLHSKCDAVRKELIKLSKVIRLIDRNGTTIELALQTQQTLLLLKNQNTGAIGVLLK